MHGGLSGSFNSSYFDSNYLGNSDHGTIDTYTAVAAFQPTQKFHFSVSTDYSTNLAGSLYEAATSTGGVAVPAQNGQSSHALDLQENASYSIKPNLQGMATADYRQQYFLGKSYSSESYGGGVTYGRPLWGGSFNVSLSMTDNMASNSDANNLGFSGAVNYNKRFNGWAAGGFFSYSQNVQTLLITEMSSIYSYGGSIRRRFGEFGWNAGASVSKTGLTTESGIVSTSESFNTGLSYSKWWNLTSSYSKSSGNGIQSGAGVVVTPTPEPVVGATDLILFGGKSYSFGLSSTPKRKLTLSASYARSESNSSLSGIRSNSDTKQFHAFFQYQFRKMYLTGGYSNLVQGFNRSGKLTPQENVSAFFIGVSRWFNFF